MSGMSERERRIVQNETLFRQVNEQVESLQRATGTGDEPMRIVCECGDLTCIDRLAVPHPTYEQVRGDPTLFFVKPGHEITAIEDVIVEGDEFSVVRKRAGEPTDPRA
jgi:hypothetical protein